MTIEHALDIIQGRIDCTPLQYQEAVNIVEVFFSIDRP